MGGFATLHFGLQYPHRALSLVVAVRFDAQDVSRGFGHLSLGRRAVDTAPRPTSKTLSRANARTRRASSRRREFASSRRSELFFHSGDFRFASHRSRNVVPNMLTLLLDTQWARRACSFFKRIRAATRSSLTRYSGGVTASGFSRCDLRVQMGLSWPTRSRECFF